MNSQPVCIYHKDCSDGTAAAAVFLKKFPDGKTFPFAYGYTQEDADVVLSTLAPDTTVYTVDCCILAKECLEKGNKVISLDHHIGIYEETIEFAKTQPNYTYIFNNELSGATVTWTYFFPNEQIPQWLTLVQDKDLWTKKYVESEYFANWSYTQANNPQALSFLFDDLKNLDFCIEKGKAVEDVNQFYISAFQEKTKPLYVVYKDHKVPAYNSTYLQSALGNLLVDDILGVSIIFSIKGDRVRMSIRSIKDSKVSALEIAQSFGGGGHKSAAGCELTLLEFIKSINLQEITSVRKY